MNAANFFVNFPDELPAEFVEVLAKGDGVRIERIISHGHVSPEGYWYDQDEHEFVLLVQGAARLRIEDGVIEMKPGDWINFPAHQKHRVEWTTPDEKTIWMAVFYTDLN